MSLNIMSLEISQECHVSVVLLQGVSTNWRLFMVVFLLYVNHYCLTVIADVIATYFIFFLFVGLVMNMCVQER